MAVYTAPIEPGGSTPLDWRLGINVTSAYSALAAAVERDGYLSNQAYVDLAGDLAEGGEDWNTFARWYKVGHSKHVERTRQCAEAATPIIAEAPSKHFPLLPPPRTAG